MRRASKRGGTSPTSELRARGRSKTLSNNLNNAQTLSTMNVHQKVIATTTLSGEKLRTVNLATSIPEMIIYLETSHTLVWPSKIASSETATTYAYGMLKDEASGADLRPFSGLYDVGPASRQRGAMDGGGPKA